MVATETDGSDRASRLPCEVWSRWIIGAQAGGNRQRRRTVMQDGRIAIELIHAPFLNAGAPAEYRAGFKGRFSDLEVPKLKLLNKWAASPSYQQQRIMTANYARMRSWKCATSVSNSTVRSSITSGYPLQ